MAALTERQGWRTASLVVTFAALAVVPFVVLVLRDYPEDRGVTAYGAPPGRPQPRAIDSTGAASRALRALAEAARTRTFWALAGGFAICGATTNGLIGTHFVPSAHDHGMPATTAAGLLALVGIFDIAGTVVSGVLTDRIDPRLLLVCYYFFRGVGLLVLPWLLSTPCTRACSCSSSSTVWIGWPRCHPRRPFAEKRSERPARSCSAGCSPHTRSGRPSPLPRRGSYATRPANTLAWFGGAGLCLVAAIVSVTIRGRQRSSV